MNGSARQPERYTTLTRTSFTCEDFRRSMMTNASELATRTMRMRSIAVDGERERASMRDDR